MKKQNIFVSILIIVLAVAAGVLIARRHVAPSAQSSDASASGTSASMTGDKSFTLDCDSSKSMIVTFHLPEDKSVDLMLSDGRQLSLGNTSNATSASYTSADGADVLALSGSTLTLSENAKPTYSNCVLSSAGPAAQ